MGKKVKNKRKKRNANPFLHLFTYLSIFFVLLISLFALTSCVSKTKVVIQKNISSSNKSVMKNKSIEYKKISHKKEVNFTTIDDVMIYANYYENDNSNRSIILLHMLNKNKESYDEFANLLYNYNFSILSIDLRGHGKSIFKGNNKYIWQDFTKEDFNAMPLDVRSGENFLNQKNKVLTAIIGASIGANTALKYGCEFDKDKKLKIVLLSPGLNYRGIDLTTIKDCNQEVIIFVGEYDSYSFESSKVLSKKFGWKVYSYKTNAHGTELLSFDDVRNKIIDFLK